MPQDPMTGLAAIPYTAAFDYGYIKVDLLHLTILDSFSSKAEVRKLMNTEPDWNLLDREDIVSELFQLSKHFDLINRIRPRNVDELADTIALIRPGKRYLLDEYLVSRATAREFLYKPPLDKNVNWFKKSHAIAYAFNVILQLHKIKERIDKGNYDEKIQNTELLTF